MPQAYRAVKHFALPLIVFLALPVLLYSQEKAYPGALQYARSEEIPGAKRVGSQTCATCHAQQVKDYQHAFHAQQGVQCEDCHGAGSLHVQSGGDVSKIISFSKRSARQANAVCLSCHLHDQSVRNWTAGPHATNGVRCTDCHQIHESALQESNRSQASFDTATRGALAAASVSPETNVILRPMSATNDECLRCHQAERAQFSMPYHHPVREGKMSCVDCHDPHGGVAENNLRAATVNQLCLECHAQYRGPFAYQHPPVSENCTLCHVAHGSPNTNLLQVSEPALCLQCHAGHHNGAGLPLADRCTDCHSSIHGSDVPTPSGGSRFVDKGYSEPQLVHGIAGSGSIPAGLNARVTATASASMAASASARPPATAMAGVGGLLAMMGSSFATPLAGGSMERGMNATAGAEPASGNFGIFSITPGAYRFIDASGFAGRVGEYDSLQQSAGADAVEAYVSPSKHLTLVSRADVLSSADYSAISQLTLGKWLQAQFSQRSFVQQQDHYPFYAFPVLDIPPGDTAPLDTSSDAIANVERPGGAIFGVQRRMGNAYARVKVPNLPVHLFVKGAWQDRVGTSQLTYLDENDNPSCGNECHYSSQYQPVNYTTRNISGGGEFNWHSFDVVVEHLFSSFNDRLSFPVGTFTGPFDPEVEGFSQINPPPSGPAPIYVPAGNYPIDIPSPSHASADRISLNWAPSAQFNLNGSVSYTRLRDLYTNYPQNAFNTDETVNWNPLKRLLVTAHYYQQNQINGFTPYYSLFGNVSFHNHGEGVRLNYQLPRGFDVETYYRRSGITRSNAFLWPQIYSFDNTDLSYVVPASSSNTAGLALRYHNRGLWSARAGYEWTGTHDPGYLIVPQSNSRIFAEATVTPLPWLTFDNDTSIIVQNAFRAIPLPNTPGDFQRRNRFYNETATFTLPLRANWNAGLGYSYQQNNLTTYMAFQNDPSVGYVIDEPAVPYKQITQAYWANSNYTFEQRFGFNFRLTYNSSRSGFRPDVNPADAALLGNLSLQSSGDFSQDYFSAALANLQFSATQISQVIVPQWIGQSKAFYLFPHKLEGGLIFYYGSYKDYFNPSLNGTLRTFSLYLGRSW